jgi:glycosyltransferase involved in cell wall biosynthesis
VPIDDSGGGQRATQLALELLARNWRVLFLNQYPRYESVDLKIRITHPNLETLPTTSFDASRFVPTLDRGKPAFAIAEFPHPAFLPPLAELRSAGVEVIYDLIDDWRSSLGGDWYTVATEQKYLDTSDHILASARSLAKRLESMGASTVHYVPNAVNRRLFVSKPYDRPADMPSGEFTIIYVGALWGHWFDWDLLLATAEAYPRAAVVVIGDYHGQCPRSLPNLHFLGLKAQRDLPPYLANADVALITFKPSELTQAVSPLKVFEYLAMKLPVVSTPLTELESLPYVTLADGDGFVEAVGRVSSTKVDDAVIEEFLRDHSWPARVDQIVRLLRSRS